MDEEDQEQSVLDALIIIRHRLPKAQFVVTETALQELAWLTENAAPTASELAKGALIHLLDRGYTPLAMSPVERGIADEISLKFRLKEIIPYEEENDATLIAEAALKGCDILLTSDNHLLDANEDIKKLWRILKSADTQTHQIVIARPRDLVRKFALRQ